MYLEIRSFIEKNKSLFKCARFFFTPIRLVKEKHKRKKMAETIIEKYHNCTKEDKKIIYIGIPEHNNLGDIGQTYCTRKWIAEH